MPQHSLGIDIGGTFTDIMVYDHDSGRQWKVSALPTTIGPSPPLGPHREEILKELGYTEALIRALASEGAI